MAVITVAEAMQHLGIDYADEAVTANVTTAVAAAGQRSWALSGRMWIHCSQEIRGQSSSRCCMWTTTTTSTV